MGTSHACRELAESSAAAKAYRNLLIHLGFFPLSDGTADEKQLSEATSVLQLEGPGDCGASVPGGEGATHLQGWMGLGAKFLILQITESLKLEKSSQTIVSNCSPSTAKPTPNCSQVSHSQIV